MHHGTKSEILDCIAPGPPVVDRPQTSCAVMDGPVVVQMLRPGNATTIGHYSASVFLPYIAQWFEYNQRIDVVWDVYSKSSLKSGTREKRGSGIRRRVTAATKVPGNWASFLRVDQNKQELFVALAECMKQLILQQVRSILASIQYGVLSLQTIYVISLNLCITR
jgi:hypothetical protein